MNAEAGLSKTTGGDRLQANVYMTGIHAGKIQRSSKELPKPLSLATVTIDQLEQKRNEKSVKVRDYSLPCKLRKSTISLPLP